MRDTRIQKAMADAGICSRRQAEQIITENRVQLNGRPISVGDKMDIKTDVLTVDNQRIIILRKKEFVYYMLNKPRGYITTSSDDRGRKTVLELVKDIPGRVYPVGRLDKDSEGLLLFTNDGDFANLLTHPSHQISKLYRVTVRPTVTEEQLIALANGVYLDDGTKTLPAIVHVVTQEEGRSVMEIAIREGKNRQIRRMCEAVGLEVARLKRNSVGAVKLGMLAPGKYRELKPSEIIALKAGALKVSADSLDENGNIPKKDRAMTGKPRDKKAGSFAKGKPEDKKAGSFAKGKPEDKKAGSFAKGKPADKSAGSFAKGRPADKKAGYSKTKPTSQQRPDKKFAK